MVLPGRTHDLGAGSGYGDRTFNLRHQPGLGTLDYLRILDTLRIATWPLTVRMGLEN